MSTTSVLTVSGLHCANCIAKLESGLGKVAGVSAARVNFTTRRVRVLHDEGLDAASLRDAIARIGFSAEPFAGEADTEAGRETRALSKALAVAGFASMNVMLLSVSVWSGAEGATRQLFHWLSALIALPAVAYAGRPFFSSAWNALRHGRTNMDVPISIGVTLTCAASLFETITHGRHAYFDGAVMLLFFLLAGRLLDTVMRARAEDGVAALMRQTATGAMVLAKDGTTEWRTYEELAPGMRILVAAGERIAADGLVETGSSGVDCALITGESLPKPVAPGSHVLAGTINIDAALTVKVTATGERTVLADIARTMEAASQSKSHYVRLADRAARWYAPAVHLLAALSFAGWMIAGTGWHEALLIAVAVLIITCPCALGLAVPVAQVVSAGALMRAGIIVKDGSALERLAEVDTALFDKTGTLTLGRPSPLGQFDFSNDECPVALALAQASRHPLSKALATMLIAQGVTPAALDDIAETPGRGVEGWLDGRRARLGQPGWIGIDAEGDSLATAFRLGDAPPRLLRFEDAPRVDSEAAIERLRQAGIPSRIVSGDRAPVVEALARRLGVAASPELSPRQKFEAIERLQADGRHVLMVGDGINDGPALKAAHVSMAPSSASDVGQTAADLLFLGDRLMPVAIAVSAARRTMAVVRQNFVAAIGYNVIAVPLAITGYVTPLVAALAMSGSSIIVIANALRLRNAAR